MDLTLFAPEFPDAEFNAPFAGRQNAESSTEPAEQPAAPSSLGPILITLLILLGLAALANYLNNRQEPASEIDAAAE